MMYKFWRGLSSWFLMISLAVILALSLPHLVRYFLTATISAPMKAQREAVAAGNKTSDTASGVIGTYVNNIPLNFFEELTTFDTVSFKTVKIQIPRIYVTGPLFKMDDYEDDLQDIWIQAFNINNLEEQYKNFEVYYDGALINDNGNERKSKDPTSNQIDKMKKDIVTAIETDSKLKKNSFEKWHIPKNGSDPTKYRLDGKTVDIQKIKSGDSIQFESVYVTSSWLGLKKSLVKITATFTYDEQDGFTLNKDSIKQEKI